MKDKKELLKKSNFFLDRHPLLSNFLWTLTFIVICIPFMFIEYFTATFKYMYQDFVLLASEYKNIYKRNFKKTNISVYSFRYIWFFIFSYFLGVFLANSMSIFKWSSFQQFSIAVTLFAIIAFDLFINHIIEAPNVE